MARTTVAAVRDTIDTDLVTEEIVTFIKDANAWVTDFLGGEGLASTRLEKIERYLACHYITLRDPRLKSSTRGDVVDVYQRELYKTEYLKQAAAEDPTGIVKSLLVTQSEATTISFRHGGFAAGT